ncbi:MAG: sulfotransferase domain-containing protein [Cyanobacteriota bacterium]|nr:sulfotransferase domain-containing protein [Cyanobacteriota bacterium]
MQRFKFDFVGVGPQRTGSSWLYQMLQSHPSLCFPKNVKETMFFEKYYDRGLAWYAAHFNERREGQLCGEIGSTYFDVEMAPERIHQLNPHCKIIINLRHPLQRAESLYRHALSLGEVEGSFSNAVAQKPRIVEAGYYSRHLPRWLETFGRDRIFWILLEDIQSQPDRVLKSIYDFLEIEAIELPDGAKGKINTATMPRFPLLAKIATQIAIYLRANRWHRVVELGKALGLRRVYTGSKTLPSLTLEEREELFKLYQKEVEFVENLTRRSLPEWYKYK